MKVADPLILIEIEAESFGEVMEEDVFLPEEAEEEEELLLDYDVEDFRPTGRRKTSMEYHSRLNGWKQSDFI